jgi:hypothetical protein
MKGQLRPVRDWRVQDFGDTFQEQPAKSFPAGEGVAGDAKKIEQIIPSRRGRNKANQARKSFSYAPDIAKRENGKRFLAVKTEKARYQNKGSDPAGAGAKRIAGICAMTMGSLSRANSALPLMNRGE